MHTKFNRKRNTMENRDLDMFLCSTYKLFLVYLYTYIALIFFIFFMHYNLDLIVGLTKLIRLPTR